MISDVTRQAGSQYRGVTLPEGMTPHCFDEVMDILRAFELGESGVFAEDVALTVFEVVRRRLASKDRVISN